MRSTMACLAALLSLVVCAVASPAFSKDVSKPFHLGWNAAKDIDEYEADLGKLQLASFAGHVVSVCLLTDGRTGQKDPQAIGRHAQYAEQFGTARTTTSIPEWCSSHFVRELAGLHVAVADSSDASILICGTILRCFVDEDDRYIGTLSLHLAVRDPRGSTIWEGVIDGKGDNWGEDLDPNLYCECLSNALRCAVLKFANLEALHKGLDTVPKASPQAAANAKRHRPKIW
jgi:hypothetical protein